MSRAKVQPIASHKETMHEMTLAIFTAEEQGRSRDQALRAREVYVAKHGAPALEALLESVLPVLETTGRITHE